MKYHFKFTVKDRLYYDSTFYFPDGRSFRSVSNAAEDLIKELGKTGIVQIYPA